MGQSGPVLVSSLSSQGRNNLGGGGMDFWDLGRGGGDTL